MQTTNVQINNETWTKLNNTDIFVIQNSSPSSIRVLASDLEPTIEGGIVLNPTQGITNIIAMGTFWAKSTSDVAIITVTE